MQIVRAKKHLNRNHYRAEKASGLDTPNNYHLSFKRQPHKMAEHTQTIRRLLAYKYHL